MASRLGDKKKISPYRSGRQLVAFFNDLGFDDLYDSQFPSRRSFAEAHLRSLADEGRFAKAVEAAFDDAWFAEHQMPIDDALEYINLYLRSIDAKVELRGKRYKVVGLTESVVEVEVASMAREIGLWDRVHEILGRADLRISENDFMGAITLARTSVETVLFALAEHLDVPVDNYEGNLLKLYKTVRKALRLDPADQVESDSLKQILTGLVTVVNGIAAVSNSSGDRHATKYRPSRHHARLMCNCAKTLCEFLLATAEFQGLIKPSAVS